MSLHSKMIPLSKPSITNKEIRAVKKVLRSGWLTTASQAKLFESNFSKLTGATYSLAVNSATSGLHLALEAIGIGPEDKIITSPYTFTASAEVIRYFNADPLFVDVSENSYNIDPEKIETAIVNNRKDVKAIIVIHVAGRLCNMSRIMEISKKYNIPVIEDSAHAFPLRTKDGFAGTIGDIGVYSFYANKTITTGEGGMITTNNSDYNKRMQTLRLHGIDRDVWNRYSKSATENSWEYDVVEAGYKYNLSDIQASIGVVQLKRAFALQGKRESIASFYNDQLSNIKGIEVPQFTNEHSWHLYIIKITNEIKISRNQFMKELFARGIGVSVHFKPLHLMSYYSKRYNYSEDSFPNAYEVYKKSISIPIYPDMRKKDMKRVVDAIKQIAEKMVI